MQEGVGVPVDSMSICHQAPVEDRIFALYLFAVVAIVTVRSFAIVKYFWVSRRKSAQKPSSDTEIATPWGTCNRKVQSSMRLVILTLMLSAVLTTHRLMGVFTNMTVEKRFGVAYSGSIAEILACLWLGLTVSAAVYAACLFYEGALARRKARLGS